MKNFIVSRLIENKNKNIISFHTPGHKNGRIFKKLGYSEILDEIYKIDTTEIIGTDNLHSPEEIIKRSQERAAKVFNAKHTYYLVNGSTCGIQAAILSVCNDNDSKIIVNRDCHQSVVNTCVMGNIDPVYIPYNICEKTSILKGVNIESVKKVIDSNLDAKAVVLTYPTYYGMTYDLGKICEYAHSKGILVIVDEAHGAHLELSDKLPTSSLKLDADIVIQSCHKTLPSFTQSSLLHLNSSRVDANRVSSFLRILESSSPSYLLLTSLEIAVDIYERYGKKLMEELLLNITEFNSNFDVEYIDSDSNLYKTRPVKNTYLKNAADFKIFQPTDKTKIFISSTELGIDGYKFEEILRYKYNIQVELSNYYGVLLLCSIANEIDDFDMLKIALMDIKKNIKGKKILDQIEFPKITPKKALTPLQAFYKHTKSVKIDKSIGQICAESLTPYPPGVNLISPGEIVDREVLEYILYCKEKGMYISGSRDKDLKFIEVIDNSVDI